MVKFSKKEIYDRRRICTIGTVGTVKELERISQQVVTAAMASDRGTARHCRHCKNRCERGLLPSSKARKGRTPDMITRAYTSSDFYTNMNKTA
jgi:hypothetical protein